MIFRYSTKIQALAWGFAGLLMPVSCMILSDLIAAEVAAGHRVDDADGAFVRRDAPGSGGQGFSPLHFWWGAGLNVVYFASAIMFFGWIFEKARSRGLLVKQE